MEIITSLIFLLCLILLPIGLIVPSLFSKLFKRNINRKHLLLIFGGGLILTIVIMVNLPSSKKQAEERKNKNISSTDQTTITLVSTYTPTQTPTLTQVVLPSKIPSPSVLPTSSSTPTVTPKKILYERLFYKKLNNLENITYLYLSSDKSKETVENVIREIKELECKMPCNISLFDDKIAAELDNQYNQLFVADEIESWKKINYIFVADHFIGFLDFDGNGIFYYYMWKDWYYNELKNI